VYGAGKSQFKTGGKGEGPNGTGDKDLPPFWRRQNSTFTHLQWEKKKTSARPVGYKKNEKGPPKKKEAPTAKRGIHGGGRERSPINLWNSSNSQGQAWEKKAARCVKLQVQGNNAGACRTRDGFVFAATPALGKTSSTIPRGGKMRLKIKPAREGGKQILSPEKRAWN